MKHIPFDPEAPLVLHHEINPWLERVAEDIHVFSIRLDLLNRSDIPAESPLILFPRLGLDIRPQPPMLVRPSVSGSRRVLSCVASRTLRVAPHASLTACRILFNFDRSDGKISFTGHDGWCRGERTDDFRILCATGAANFPLRRSELIVAANLLHAAVNRIFMAAETTPPPAPAETMGPALLALGP